MNSQNLSIQQLGAESTTINQTISEKSIKLVIKEKKDKEELPPAIVYACKICLEEVEISRKVNSGLITPCMCSGSMKYVHSNCLVEWLNTIVWKNLQNGLNTTNIGCEICKTEYQYETKQKYTCVSRVEMVQRIKLNWGIFLLGIIFILGATAGCITLGILVGARKLNFADNSAQKIMLIIVIVLMTLVFFFWSARLIYVFFVKALIFIKRVLERQCINESQNQLLINPENSSNFNPS